MPLNAGIFRLSLHRTSASAVFSAGSISVFSEAVDRASGGGWSTAGRTLAGVAWTTGASATQQKWDVTDPVITAIGSTLSSVRFALIRNSVGALTSGHVLCYAALSNVAFDITTGNTLTIQMAATGVFTLT
jgi:hypothetical protein